jgi:hypothetical protein
MGNKKWSLPQKLLNSSKKYFKEKEKGKTCEIGYLRRKVGGKKGRRITNQRKIK